MQNSTTSESEPRRVAVVTGSSRGAGKGIALALGDSGATVYVTGRTTVEGTAAFSGTVHQTAAEITRRGGQGIAVVCDHSDDGDVERLFAQVKREQGRLDILVNNAFKVPDTLTDIAPFWEKPLDLQDMIEVGLRSTYVASYFAAPLLTRTPDALLVNTSGFGGVAYLHGPAYGAVKAGVDKMAHDFAVDFAPYGVTSISLWMSMLKTERTIAYCAQNLDRYGDGELRTIMESPEFVGRVISAFHLFPDKLEWSGRVFIGAELGAFFGVAEPDGTSPRSRRAFLGDPPSFSAAVVR